MSEITVEEIRAFIADACKCGRDEWLNIAQRSWGEIKNRKRDHRLWSVTPNSIRVRSRYPLWYSIFKIRQGLVLSRAGIPIGKDTTQDGRDNIGATAAMCLERLAINLAKTFPFYDVMCTVRDDCLATNFGNSRAYYEAEYHEEKVKEYITPVDDGQGGKMFVDASGKEVLNDNVFQDEDGFYIQHSQTVDIKDEKVCLEPTLYSEVLVDPDVRHWARCKRLAFVEYYSEKEFKRLFGAEALRDIKIQLQKNDMTDSTSPKREKIKVYEYWDEYENEVCWLADLGTTLIKPVEAYLPEDDENEDEVKGLYNLDKFFPCPPPMMINQPTDEFWPVCEYFQLIAVLEDIHTIFSKMVAMTKAIRTRLLFDNNIDGLQEALNEGGTGDCFGVTNLAQLLSANGGSLDGVVQYIPVEKAIEGLNQLYTALEQRLNTVYRLTGTSDMLQGLAQDQTQRTFGERQMTEKYALNQLSELQDRMQKYVRDSYQLITEMAIKNFTDESLEKYIIPRTLPPVHQQNFPAALALLKSDYKRFRIELETDSTIAINEEYDKNARVQFVEALTQGLQAAATTAETSPALVIPNLQALKYLIQGFRQAKMFQEEITQAIDSVVQGIQAQQEAAANEPPPFNKDEAEIQYKYKELETNAQLKQMELTSEQQIAILQAQQEQAIASLKADLDAFKVQSEAANNQAQTQIDYQKLSADVSIAQQELVTKHDALMIELQKVTDKKEYDAIKLAMEKQLTDADMQLRAVQQQLESYRVQSDEKEKWATEERLQNEHKLDSMETQIRMMSMMKELKQPIEVMMPEPKKYRKKVKVKRDENGEIESFEAENSEG